MPLQMDENEILALLRLQVAPGIGPVSALKLIQHFGSAAAIFRESVRNLKKVTGIGGKMARSLLEGSTRDLAESEWRRLQEGGVRCIPYGGQGYPHLLRQCADAPLLLFARGVASLSQRRMISIVGTRNMTRHGRAQCERLIHGLVPYQPVVVSGLAHGVDICAHRAALEAGLETIACLAHGLDQVYPVGHARYLPAILEQGSVVSEFWLGTPPQPMHFVRRNRIIAGLSEATLVVESGARGGSLITADLAFGYDREVFAVPGRPADPFSQGCNQLIRQQKAQLVDVAVQLAEAMGWEAEAVGREPQPSVSGDPGDLHSDERSVMAYLSAHGTSLLDDIAVGCGRPVQEVVALLFNLEMKGYVDSLPGKRYGLKGH